MSNPILESNPLQIAGRAVGQVGQAVGQVGQAVGQVLSPLGKFNLALAESCLTPDALPPGAQDPFAETAATMRRPPPGTNPVVLIHGTWANRYNTFKTLSPELSSAGFSVFALNYGESDGTLPKVIKGYGDIRTSAKELARFVDEVLHKTGAHKVDLVGHSQGGGIMPRWYLKYEGGSDKVDKLIGLAPSNHGTTLFGMQTLCNVIMKPLCIQGIVEEGVDICAGKAALQQSLHAAADALHPQLDEDGDTFPGISYVVVATRHDQTITPYTQCALKGAPRHKVVNLVIQELRAFKLDLTDHVGIANHPVTWEVVKRALGGKPIDVKTLDGLRIATTMTP